MFSFLFTLNLHNNFRTFLFILLLLRKTPVHKLLTASLGQRLQSEGPTKAPAVLPQLPQGFHNLYTHIEYECVSQYYQHSGSSRRTCLKTGKWSGRHVSCSPGEGSRGQKNNTWKLSFIKTKKCITSLCGHSTNIMNLILTNINTNQGFWIISSLTFTMYYGKKEKWTLLFICLNTNEEKLFMDLL